MKIEKFAISLLLKLLPLIIPNISRVLREALVEAIEELEKKAQETKNPYDDMLVALLKELLVIEK